MLTPSIIRNVFPVKNGKRTGTCFTIDYDTNQYFVTAKHIIKNLQNGNCVEFLISGNLIKTNVKTIGHHHTADVSVFTINDHPELQGLKFHIKETEPGQDVHLIGFPTGTGARKSDQSKKKYPQQLIKKATVSRIINNNTDKYLLLNGINNPGFSGGPVILKDPTDRTFKVAAVISGHKPDETIYPDKKVSPVSIRNRTGIILAYSVENVLELIENLNAQPGCSSNI